MATSLDYALAIQSSEQFSELKGVEYLFHEALEKRKLVDLLQKFPNYNAVKKKIDEQVVKFEPLEVGWEKKMLVEVKELIGLLHAGDLISVNQISQGKVNYDSDEMFELRGRLSKWFRNNSIDSIDAHKRLFLNDLFYGIDFSHWTKWCFLMNYSKSGLELPMILKARRNGVEFAINNHELIYGLSSSSKS